MIRRLLKKFHYGEKGFTLIELLVVVAILGILAAVIIPNVMNMMGTGTVQAANTEADNVQIAVTAAMVKYNVYELDVDTASNRVVGPGSGTTTVVGENGTDISTYVNNNISGLLQATYQLDSDGHITSATPASGGKWSALSYDLAGQGGWYEP